MQIHQILKRGFGHKNHCEDYVLVNNNNPHFLLAAAFDGCSSGTESFFASALFGKTLQNCFRNLDNNNTLLNTSELLYNITSELMKQVYEIHKLLGTNNNEMLTTAIILILDKRNKNGSIFCAGDGVISINGVVHKINQNNQPDYPAYYFNTITNTEDFTEWYHQKNKIIHFTQGSDISISTDGIESFTAENDIEKNITTDAIIAYLVSDTFLAGNKAMLSRKCNILKNNHTVENFDDLGMVRIIT